MPDGLKHVTSASAAQEAWLNRRLRGWRRMGSLGNMLVKCPYNPLVCFSGDHPHSGPVSRYSSRENSGIERYEIRRVAKAMGLLLLPELLNDIGLAAVPNWWSKLDVRPVKCTAHRGSCRAHATLFPAPTNPHSLVSADTQTCAPRHRSLCLARGSLHRHSRSGYRTRARALGICRPGRAAGHGCRCAAPARTPHARRVGRSIARVGRGIARVGPCVRRAEGAAAQQE